MRVLPLLLLTLAFETIAQAAPWAGTYITMGSKGTVTLTLRDIPDGIAGTLAGGGATFTLEGDNEDDGSISGLTIDAKDEPTAEFTLKKVGNAIEMEVGPEGGAKTKLVFKPVGQGGAAPVASVPAKSTPAKAPADQASSKPAPKIAPLKANPTRIAKASARQPSGGPQAGKAGWTTYTHPIGLKFRHPVGWAVTEDQGILYVMPKDVKRDAAGPTEGYMVAGQPAQGITSINDPGVIQHLDQELRQMGPFLQRTGEPVAATAANTPGILTVWEGTNPKGQLIQARVYATLFQGHAVAVIALGVKNQIAARENIVKAMFASLGAGAGKRDARLVGGWKFWSYKASADGKFGTEKTRYFTFRADGSCVWSSQSESSGSVKGNDSLGNEVFRGGMAGGSGSGDSGKWSADNGKLYVLWNDGDSSMWHYRLGAGRLFLKGTGAEDEWVKTR